MDDPIVQRGKELLSHKKAALSEQVARATDYLDHIDQIISSYGETKKQDEETFRKLLVSAGEADARIPTLRKQLSRLIE